MTSTTKAMIIVTIINNNIKIGIVDKSYNINIYFIMKIILWWLYLRVNFIIEYQGLVAYSVKSPSLPHYVQGFGLVKAVARLEALWDNLDNNLEGILLGHGIWEGLEKIVSITWAISESALNLTHKRFWFTSSPAKKKEVLFTMAFLP